MKAYNVVDSRDNVTVHHCLYKHTAEHLRDWCDAIITNEQINNKWYWCDRVGYSDKEFLDFVCKSRHHVLEIEIIEE